MSNRNVTKSDTKSIWQAFKKTIINHKLLLIFILIIGSISGLWVWTFLVSNNAISIGGSASADPIMQQLSNEYRNETKNSFIYSSTGSGAGAKNVINGTYNIGVMSKSETDSSVPEDITKHLVRRNENGDGRLFQKIANGQSDKENTFNNIKKEKKVEGSTGYHFVEFAKDSIVFIYNIKDTGLTNEQINEIKFSVEEKDNKNILDKDANKALYNLYSKNKQSNLITWRKFYKLITGKDEKNISNKTKVTPYATNNGSGTRSSFETIAGFKSKKQKIGEAVNQYNSNGSIFTQVSKSSGSFGFVSMEYASQIKNYPNLRAVIISKGKNNTWDLNEKPDEYEGYPLNRPFVMLYKMTNDEKRNDMLLNFIYWISSSNNPVVTNAYKHLGLIQNWKKTN